MQIGMIGLGRMGANMVRRLIRGGHACAVHDVSAIVGTARRWAAISAGGNVRHAGAGRGFRTRALRAAGAGVTGRA